MALRTLRTESAPELIRIDREGLDYLLYVCSEMGFVAKRIATEEDDGAPPEVTITFVQERIAEKPKKEPEPDQAPIIADEGEMMLDGTKL
jgi:hypothetical protein